MPEQRIIVPKDRVFERGMACSNCIHRQDAVKFWADRRQINLARALTISIESPQGEADYRVQNIRVMVNKSDHAVASGALIHCEKCKTAHGEPVGDLIPHSYLCEKWTAAEGASVARGGGKADTLPEELVDKLDGDQSARAADAIVSSRFKVE
jgi:hypothetical protein